ncbi:MAG: hypothetical protein AB7O62_20610 [Pirellulales bacterium]
MRRQQFAAGGRFAAAITDARFLTPDNYRRATRRRCTLGEMRRYGAVLRGTCNVPKTAAPPVKPGEAA